MNDKTNAFNYIIIGAGITGMTAIKGIRELDSEGSILLLSNEQHLPYKRTKINKHIAVGFAKNDFALKPMEWFTEQKVTLVHHAVTKIDNGKKQIFTSEVVYTYDKLLLSMGAKPNMPLIDGLEKVGCSFVHFAKEVEEIIAQSKNKNDYLIIGGGIEGLETADQLLQLNKNVTIVQRSVNPLRDLFPEAITKKVHQAISKSKIIYIENEQIQRVQLTDGKIVAQSEGHIFNVDEIIICAGSNPSIDLLRGTNIETNKGTLVNEYLQTIDKDVYAAGDIAEHPHGLVTGLWHPAEYQGLAAGRNMTGKNDKYIPVPYRLKSEFLGHFLFSANYHLLNKDKLKVVKESNDAMHREFYVKGNAIKAITMLNDKERAKSYQKAVAEQWSLEKIKKEVPMP